MIRIAPPIISGAIASIAVVGAWLMFVLATGIIDTMSLPIFLLSEVVVAFATSIVVNVVAGRLEIDVTQYEDLKRARDLEPRISRRVDEVSATGRVTVGGYNSVVALRDELRLESSRNALLREREADPA